MKIEYKKIVPYCGECGEPFGNGDIVFIYKCKCGEWEYDYEKKEFILK